MSKTRAATKEDIGKCIYCRKPLVYKKEIKLGFHADCKTSFENGFRFSNEIVVSSESYQNKFNALRKSNPGFIGNLVGGLAFTSKKILKEAAVESVVRSKQAVQHAKDILATADKRLNKDLQITNEEEAYAAAASEVDTGKTQPGIWAMAFADAEGDEQKQKALYIKYRAKKLLDAFRQQNL